MTLSLSICSPHISLKQLSAICGFMGCAVLAGTSAARQYLFDGWTQRSHSIEQFNEKRRYNALKCDNEQYAEFNEEDEMSNR